MTYFTGVPKNAIWNFGYNCSTVVPERIRHRLLQPVHVPKNHFSGFCDLENEFRQFLSYTITFRDSVRVAHRRSTVRVPMMTRRFVCSLLQTVRVPAKFSFFPKFDVGLDYGSSAAFFNYATTAMCDGTPPPAAFPRADDPGRGHERPPPAIVCGKNGENLRTKFSKFFRKLKLRNLPAPCRPCPPRGPLAPVPQDAGMCATLHHRQRWRGDAITTIKAYRHCPTGYGMA